MLGTLEDKKVRETLMKLEPFEQSLKFLYLICIHLKFETIGKEKRTIREFLLRKHKRHWGNV